jgi:hypothetical protein
MSHRPHPSVDRALHQLYRHDDETGPRAEPRPVTPFEQRLGEQAAAIMKAAQPSGAKLAVQLRAAFQTRPAPGRGAHHMSAPVSGTTRYLCPLECGWHHDAPPPSAERIAELGATAGPAAQDIQEAITSVAHRASLAEAERTETALREHLATHTTEQFVRVIHDLRAEVARLHRATEPAPW